MQGKDYDKLPRLHLSQFKDASRESLIKSVKEWASKHNDEKVIVIEHTDEELMVNRFIPTSVYPIVMCSPMKQNFEYYWWLAVTSTYVMRPNNDTIYAFHYYNNHTYNSSPDHNNNTVSNQTEAERDKMVLARPHLDHILTRLAVPTNPGQYIRSSSPDLNAGFTSRDRCVGMYVRHGDKGGEMKLLPVNKYLEVASFLYRHNLSIGNDESVEERERLKKLLAGNDSSTRALNDTHHIQTTNFNHIFIGTENPDVIREAMEWGKKNSINVFYTDLFDRSLVSARLDQKEMSKVRFQCNGGYTMVVRAGGRSQCVRQHPLEYLSMIINLFYMIKCDAWVCTLQSNWCRLVDELRATVGGKANRYFADLSEGTCASPPCLVDGIYAYEWRRLQGNQ